MPNLSPKQFQLSQYLVHLGNMGDMRREDCFYFVREKKENWPKLNPIFVFSVKNVLKLKIQWKYRESDISSYHCYIFLLTPPSLAVTTRLGENHLFFFSPFSKKIFLFQTNSLFGANNFFHPIHYHLTVLIVHINKGPIFYLIPPFDQPWDWSSSLHLKTFTVPSIIVIPVIAVIIGKMSYFL